MVLLLIACILLSAAGENPNVTCPAGAVAQDDLPCPGNTQDVPLPSLNPLEPNKTGVRVLPVPGTKPNPFGCALNAEGKPELLGLHDVTPFENFYTRNHGNIPKRAISRDMTGWKLIVDGEVDTPMNFTMEQLKAMPSVSRQHVLECAGNGRHGYKPQVNGNQWTIGPAGNGNWTGVLLKDVLKAAGVKSSAVYIGWYSEDADCDAGPSGAGKLISRGVPIEKALDGYTMLAYEMNGGTLPSYHGFPLRLVAPGFPGAAWGKWLTRIWVRNQTHDGAKMGAPAYRLPINPIKPGQHDTTWDGWNNDNMKIITQMPVRALITTPDRCLTQTSKDVTVAGKTWSGAGDVKKVEVTYDHGNTWTAADLTTPANKWAWQSWTAKISLPSDGTWSIYARATDESGATQPMTAPYWNPKGYQNNACMDLQITIGASF